MPAGPSGPVRLVKALNCPNCGGTVQLRGYAQSINAVCPNCSTILDTRTPTLSILQAAQSQEKFQPLIPLGSRGKLYNILHEVIGFSVRAITVDGVVYRWSEYLLYNPYLGYRYLSEYNGHWNCGRTVPVLPVPAAQGKKEAAVLYGKTYVHFQTADATTVYVAGEFPWQVRTGEVVKVKDYVAPPNMLSAEISGSEVTWSLAEYVTGESLWQTFQLKGAPPRPQGVFANQPNPHSGHNGSMWLAMGQLACIFFLVVIALGIMNHKQPVFKQDYNFEAPARGEASFVTPVFDLKGASSGVNVRVATDLRNDWAYFNFALINETDGHAYDFGREVSYYSGHDSDGNWTEGSDHSEVTIPAVPSGRYYLRVEPEMDSTSHSSLFQPRAMRYTITVSRGGGAWWAFIWTFFLLFIPPIWEAIRTFNFENTRWAESDYGPLIQSSSGDGDD